MNAMNLIIILFFIFNISFSLSHSNQNLRNIKKRNVLKKDYEIIFDNELRNLEDSMNNEE